MFALAVVILGGLLWRGIGTAADNAEARKKSQAVTRMNSALRLIRAWEGYITQLSEIRQNAEALAVKLGKMAALIRGNTDLAAKLPVFPQTNSAGLNLRPALQANPSTTANRQFLDPVREASGTMREAYQSLTNSLHTARDLMDLRRFPIDELAFNEGAAALLELRLSPRLNLYGLFNQLTNLSRGRVSLFDSYCRYIEATRALAASIEAEGAINGKSVEQFGDQELKLQSQISAFCVESRALGQEMKKALPEMQAAANEVWTEVTQADK
ncbi:MAG: hypothetical protein JNN07_18380 [Verrucomicrobiales bacterium]|nr:hypothetical protein [Verrucomicrobiales bacterium]